MFEDISFDHFYSELQKVLKSTFTNTDFFPDVRIEHEFNAQAIIELYQDIIYGKQECRVPIIILHHEAREHLRPVIIMPALTGSWPTVFFPWMTIENSHLAELVDEFMTGFDKKFSSLEPLFTRALHVSCHSPHPDTFSSEIVKTDEHFCLYQLFYLFRREEMLGKTIHSLPLQYDELLSAFDLFDFSLSIKKPLPSVRPSSFSSGPPRTSVSTQENYFTSHRPEKNNDLETLKTLSFQSLTRCLLKNESLLGEYAFLLNQYVQTPSLENLHAIHGGKPHSSIVNENQEIVTLLMTRFLEKLQEVTGYHFLCEFPVPLDCFDFHFDMIAKFADKWKTFFNQENYFSFLPLLFSLFSGKILPRSLYLLSLVCEEAHEVWPTSVNSPTLMTPVIPPVDQEMWVRLLRAMLFQDPMLIPPPPFLLSLFHDQLDFDLSLSFLPQEDQFNSLRDIILNAQSRSHDDYIPMIERIFSEYEMAVGPDKEKLKAIKTFLISDESLPIPDFSFIHSNMAARTCVNTWLKALDNTGHEEFDQRSKMLDRHLFHMFPDVSVETASNVIVRKTSDLAELNLDQEDEFASLERDLLSGRYNFQQALILFISRVTHCQIKLQHEIADNEDFSLFEENDRLNDLLLVCTQENLIESFSETKYEFIRQQLCLIKTAWEDREFESIDEDVVTRAHTYSPVAFFNKNSSKLSETEISKNLSNCLTAYISLKEQGNIEENEENTRFFNLLNAVIKLPLFHPQFYNQHRDKIEEVITLQEGVNLSLQLHCT